MIFNFETFSLTALVIPNKTGEWRVTVCVFLSLSEDLLRVLTTHSTYQVVVNQYLKPEEAVSPPVCSSSTNGKVVNNNRNMSNGNTTPSSNKKTD